MELQRRTRRFQVRLTSPQFPIPVDVSNEIRLILSFSVNAGFDEHDIPMDVIWLDIEHTDGKR